MQPEALMRLRNISLVLFSLCAVFLAELALSAPYTAGKDYETINPAQPTNTGKKVEVVELFWYGCPHCYKFEPYIQRWKKKKPANVEFIVMPAIFRPEWALFARAYYTAEVMGILDDTHEAFFEAIHELKQKMNSEAAILAFFKEHGADEAKFKKTYRSFAVESKVRRAMDMTKRYGAKGVPTMVVNGKYRTSATLTGTHNNTLKVVDYLIAEESK